MEVLKDLKERESRAWGLEMVEHGPKKQRRSIWAENHRNQRRKMVRITGFEVGSEPGHGSGRVVAGRLDPAGG